MPTIEADGQELSDRAEADIPADRAPLGQLSAVHDIAVRLSVVLGRATMPVSRLLQLGRGAVVELDRGLHEPVEIYVNDRLVARGEVTVIDDHLGVTLTEMAKGGR
ncbi:flagellar motor switch protein FliN [Benzoatithermus flavus]|uniref:Flagellar motor switch protein FliN n=1 Tax=Benzoatithermus flavus TaxID=3108223 RepID=A0ABU8XQT9_9PROT